jgi:hypothetical protein
MQLLALGSGSFLRGGLIMLSFALGTLPALFGISLISALMEGGFARWFLRFSGVLVIVLGLANVRSGLLLLGIDAVGMTEQVLHVSMGDAEETDDPNVTIDAQGRQIVAVTVTDRGYFPSSFTIAPNKETWFYAYAPTGVQGCANFLLAPSFNMETQIKQGGNWLGPIARPRNDFVITCSMGMLRADVHVKAS